MTDSIEHTTENVEKLAHDIVEGWSLDDLIDYAFTNLSNHYMNNEEDFKEEWSEFYYE